MIPYLTQAQVRASLPYSRLIPALRDAFAAGMAVPTRHVHTLSEQRQSTLLLMPVWQDVEKPDAHMGVKLVTVAPQNTDAPSVHAVFVLFDAVSGAPLALMDGEELTARRTAAASALAASYAARSNSTRLLLVGSGHLIPYLAAAHCQLAAIKSVAVWGRSPDKAQATVDAIRAQAEMPPNIEVSVATDLAEACAAADIISCATTSRAPIVQGAWVQPGTHIDLVGGFKPDMREVDDALMAKATVFVDTYAGALQEAGDLLQPLQNGSLQRSAIVAELAQLSAGLHPGRSDAQQITVFKSVGTALEDLCAAKLAWADHGRLAAP